MTTRQDKTTPRIAIIGGGIAGLSAAWQFQKHQRDFEVSLFDVASSLGGVLQTEQVGDYLVESSADMFVSDPDPAIQLCEEIGFADQLVRTSTVGQRAYIVRDGHLHPVPQGLSMMLPSQTESILASPLLSPAGKSRFLQERDIPASKSDEDESFESFAIRRFGTEAFENIFQPLIGGIYTADSAKLSMNACLKRFVDLEQQRGSLLAAGQQSTKKQDRQSSGARYGIFVAPRNGMTSLIDHLVSKLADVQICLSHRVVSARLVDQQWQIQTESTLGSSASQAKNETFDSVVFAISARQAVGIVKNIDAELAEKLDTIEYASSAVVTIGCPESAFLENSNLPATQSFGFVVPEAENRPIIAGSFASNKFAGRAPQEKKLVRVFIGGAKHPEFLELDDNALIGLAVRQLQSLVGLEPEKTDFVNVYRWKNTMPQYHVGHLELVEQIFSRLQSHKGLEIAGSSYRGVGIPACIASGRSAAKRSINFLVGE